MDYFDRSALRIVRTVLGAALVVGTAAAPAGCSRRSRAAAAPTADRSNGEIPVVRATHVAPGAVRIDGRLDEPAWQRTGTTGAFVNPGDGRPAPESRVNATARIGWDDTFLYVGCVVEDGDPATPFRPTERDPHLWERSSAVEVMIQPGDPGDNADYYEIQVDTAGAVWDTHFDDYNRPIGGGPDESSRTFGHQEWVSGVRNAATVDRGAGRYTLELAVPWASLRSARGTASPPRAGDTWRVNLYSFRDGQRDALAWSPLLGQGNFHRAARFGRVTFAPGG